MAFETFHYMHSVCSGKKGSMAIKLDMSKAYDRVEWDFLENVMLNMGFHEQWVRMVMSCVSTVSHDVILNDDESDSFMQERGLRQATPFLHIYSLFVLKFSQVCCSVR